MNVSVKELFHANSGFLKAGDIRSRSEWRELRGLLDDNLIVKIKRGLYRLNDDTGYDQQIEVAKIVPDGVFCLFTAWQYYNLSVYSPFEFSVAIRKKQKIILPAYPPIKLYYWIDKFYLLGITEIVIDNQRVKIYDLEKSICDAIRFRNKVGMDITIEILQNYVKRKDRNLNKLGEYAQQLGIENIVRNMIMILL